MEGLNVNECMNDIYYINDMFVFKKDAEKHKRKLREAILQKKYNGDKELMDGLANVELLYNYSAKEEFGDTFIAKAFDIMEANTQLGSFYNADLWTLINFIMDNVVGGKIKGMLINNELAVVKTKLTKTIMKKFLLSGQNSKRIAEEIADLILDEAIQRAADELVSALIDYDASNILSRDISEMTERIRKSMLEGKGPIVVTFGQGNLFYKAVHSKLSMEFDVYGVLPKFLRHVNIAQIGSNPPNPNIRILLDNDDPFHDVPSLFKGDPTIINTTRNIKYNVSLELPPEYSDATVIEDYMQQNDFDKYEEFWMRDSQPASLSKEINVSVFFEGISTIYRTEAVLWAHPVDSSSNKFHDFMYYIGLTEIDTYESKDSIIKQNSFDTRDAIVGAVIAYIEEHDNKDSVWGAVNQKTEDEIQICEHRLEGDFRTQAFGAINFQGVSINSFAENSKIYPFESRVSGKSKVYKIEEEYVKGVCGGVKIDRPEAADICYNLENKSNKTVEIGRAHV
jgi:hypothetical protein